jgi:apolipoprotein N-acyltransferase
MVKAGNWARQAAECFTLAPRMQRDSLKLWGAASLSAVLLELPFPLAGPMSPWRSIFGWVGLVPLLWAVLCPATAERPGAVRRSFLLAYLSGVLWYMGNCYWIRDTMRHYGDMPPLAPELLLLGFSLVLGLYFGLFGMLVMLVKQGSNSTRLALAAAPVIWTGLELAASRITSVPWDQLGYSQVDNALVNQLAPWTGVYGITFVLVAANALISGALILRRDAGRWKWGISGAILTLAGVSGLLVAPPRPTATATAVLVQPNLDVSADNGWNGSGEWDRHISDFARLAREQCKTYIAGIPQTGAPLGEVVCPPYETHPDLVVWPEAPSPFFEEDPRFQKAMIDIAHGRQAPLIVGGIAADYSAEQNGWLDYNSAIVVGADGGRVGRYDKVHLVPFGEYIPFQNLLFFAHKLTGKVSSFSRGEERKVFRLNGRRYGIFICYEAVFADEVRQFAQLGAEVLVNISDDGWYGDTSAPWQHLNMARMRAIENRRWLLRATNNGITAAIDPYGRVRQSIPRHQEDALPAGYAFRDDVTFYSAHGDAFAWACAILSLGVAGWAIRTSLRRTIQSKVRS